MREVRSHKRDKKSETSILSLRLKLRLKLILIKEEIYKMKDLRQILF